MIKKGSCQREIIRQLKNKDIKRGMIMNILICPICEDEETMFIKFDYQDNNIIETRKCCDCDKKYQNIYKPVEKIEK